MSEVKKEELQKMFAGLANNIKSANKIERPTPEDFEKDFHRYCAIFNNGCHLPGVSEEVVKGLSRLIECLLMAYKLKTRECRSYEKFLLLIIDSKHTDKILSVLGSDSSEQAGS